MSKVIRIICYSILSIAFILTAIYMFVIGLGQKQKDDAYALKRADVNTEVKVEAEKVEPKEDVVEEDTNDIEQMCVIVKTLPVFESDDVSENMDAESKATLLYGDVISVFEVGSQYTKIEIPEEDTIGYVWNDCLGDIKYSEKELTQVIVIDAGHQKKANSDEEPNGPGADDMQKKVSGGTKGVKSKTEEHELTLDIALQLGEELEERGYVVIQTRREEKVDISNAERATLANQIDADVFIRIHANGSESEEVSGADTYYISKKNPYDAKKTYDDSKLLAECVLEAYTNRNEIKKNKTHESDNYTGLNWSKVPSVILEMGYMTNEEDDLYMEDSKNRKKMVLGIADGIDEYFEKMDIE